MNRRDLLKISALAGVAAAVSNSASAEACTTDGTPNQFIPKKAPDANPLAGDIDKYPKCPYCGMDRKEHNKTRMLVQYTDDLADGVCSIHCLALSLSLNIDREPKNIWGPDFAAEQEPRPLLPVDRLIYLIGADLKHAMTKKSKHSFASAEVAKSFQAKHGGNLGNFNDALRESYLGMSEDVAQIRKNREERRKRAMQKQQG